jgi:hypothetical protein
VQHGAPPLSVLVCGLTDGMVSGARRTSALTADTLTADTQPTRGARRRRAARRWRRRRREWRGPSAFRHSRYRGGYLLCLPAGGGSHVTPRQRTLTLRRHGIASGASGRLGFGFGLGWVRVP